MQVGCGPCRAVDRWEWVPEWRRAVRANLDDPTFRALVEQTGNLAALERLITLSIPFRFDGQRHAIASLERASSRRYAACVDAAAAIAAAAVLLGETRRAVAILEKSPGLPEYAHLRIAVRGRVFDPYAHRSLEVADHHAIRVPLDTMIGTCCGSHAHAHRAPKPGGWKETVQAAYAAQCGPSGGGSSSGGSSGGAGCPIPSGARSALVEARRLAQPIAYVAAQAYIGGVVATGPLAVILWPVHAVNLALLLGPYLLLALAASCGNPGAAVVEEAKAARKTARQLRQLYEQQPAVRFIPGAGDFYAALGALDVALVPVIERRMPTASEWQKGEAAANLASKHSPDLASMRNAAQVAGVNPSASARAIADEQQRRAQCAALAQAYGSTEGPNTMTQRTYIRAVLETLYALSCGTAPRASRQANMRAFLTDTRRKETMANAGLRDAAKQAFVFAKLEKLAAAWEANGADPSRNGVSAGVAAAQLTSDYTNGIPIPNGCPQTGYLDPKPGFQRPGRTPQPSQGGGALALAVVAAVALAALS